MCLVVQSCPTLATPWTVAHQAPLSTGFSRKESWSGLPYSPPGDLPDPGTESVYLKSPVLAGGFFTTSITREATGPWTVPMPLEAGWMGDSELPGKPCPDSNGEAVVWPPWCFVWLV